MKPHQINLITGAALVAMGLWGYLDAVEPSYTALIPVIFGIVLLALSPGLRKENKIAAHVVVVLTLLIFISLVMKPLPRVIADENTLGIVRMVIMLGCCAVALGIYIKSFIDARKAKS